MPRERGESKCRLLRKSEITWNARREQNLYGKGPVGKKAAWGAGKGDNDMMPIGNVGSSRG